MARNKDSKSAPVDANDLEPIIVKIVQAIRPGDVIFIECDQERTTKQLQHLNDQIKSKLPEVKVVILNKGSRVAKVQTLATVATKPASKQISPPPTN